MSRLPGPTLYFDPDRGPRRELVRPFRKSKRQPVFGGLETGSVGEQSRAVGASAEVCVLIADRQNVALMDVHRRPEKATAITAMAAANFTLPSNLTLPLYARGVER